MVISLSILFSKGKHWANFMPTVSPMVNCVKQAKKDEILELIHAIGVSDQVHKFYIESLINVGHQHVVQQDLEEIFFEQDSSFKAKTSYFTKKVEESKTTQRLYSDNKKYDG